MMLSEFEVEITKLISTYKAANYPAERVKQLWHAFGPTPYDLFKKSIDRIIASDRVAPMYPRIEEMISIVRSEYYQAQKREHARPVIFKELQTEDLGLIANHIKDRLGGKLGDDHWGDFSKTLKETYPSGEDCKPCKDTGLVFAFDAEGYEFVFRCRCPLGDSQPRAYSKWEEGKGYSRTRGASQ